MRCRRRGCTRVLPMKATSIVCSYACEEFLRRECEEMIAIMTGEMRARDLAPYFRDRLGHRRPTKKPKLEPR